MSQSSVYKRLETDTEFRGRLVASEGWSKAPLHAQASMLIVKGDELDHYAWGHLKMQRKIIDDWT